MSEPKVTLDHCVIAVSDLKASDAFYQQVIGAEIIQLGENYRCYKIGNQQLNVHTEALRNDPATKSLMIYADNPVVPGNSDLCFEWHGPIEDAAAAVLQNRFGPRFGH